MSFSSASFAMVENVTFAQHRQTNRLLGRSNRVIFVALIVHLAMFGIRLRHPFVPEPMVQKLTSK